MTELSIYVTTNGKHCGDPVWGAKACAWWSDHDGWYCDLFKKLLAPGNPGRTKFERCVDCHRAEVRVVGRETHLAGQRALLKEQEECIRKLEEAETR